MTDLTHVEIANAKAAQPDHDCDWFFDALKDFLDEFDVRVAKSKKPNGELCGNCTLTPYFFFSRTATYKTAIWLKVNRTDKLKVWFRIGFSYDTAANKNVNIWSECKLNCPSILMELRSFALPPDFAPIGIFKTLNRVAPMADFDPIFAQICNWMFCACTAGCKKS
jgi:hypothetical protein